MPISTIKFLGNVGSQILIRNRPSGGFKNLKDFMERVPKKFVRARARLGLLMLGSFDEISDGLSQRSLDELDLKYDLSELKDMSRTKRTLEYLGFVLPDKELIEKMDHYKYMGFDYVGIVENKEFRDKGRGIYCVYRLSPKGVFWSREKSIEEGDIIAVSMGKKGRAKKIKVIHE